MSSQTEQGPRPKVRLDANGVHLFDRATGLNVLLDEFSPPRTAWSRMPRYVSVALTNACDLRCFFCYAPKNPGRLRADDVVGWARELDGGGCLGIGFGGGEPTAHPQFAEICALTAAETGLAVTVTTHGHRFSDALIEQVRGCLHFVRVSVDAVGADYERIRGRSFGALREQLAHIATVAPFGLNMVVSDERLAQLEPVAAFAAEVGASELLLLPQQAARATSALSGAGARQLAMWIAAYRGPVRLAISRLGVPDGLPLADPYESEDLLAAHAHIDASGHLRSDAYSTVAVPIAGSIAIALEDLRAKGAK